MSPSRMAERISDRVSLGENSLDRCGTYFGGSQHGCLAKGRTFLRVGYALIRIRVGHGHPLRRPLPSLRNHRERDTAR